MYSFLHSHPQRAKDELLNLLIIDTIDVPNLVDELAGSDSGEFSNGNIVIVHGTKWAQLDAEAEVERQAIAVVNMERIAWTAPQNTQVDDAVSRLKQRMPSICIVRNYQHNHELRNMVAPHSPPELLSLDGATTETERQAVCWLNNLRKTAAMSVILPSMSILCQNKLRRWFVRILMNSQL